MEYDKDEKAFRQNLQAIDRETKIGSRSRLPIFLMTVLVLLVGVWWMYPEQEAVVQEVEETTKIMKTEEVEEQKTIEPIEKTEQEKPQKKEEKKAENPVPLPKIQKPSQPIAMADYSVNPLLESLVNNNKTSTDIVFTVQSQQSDVKLTKKNGSVNFRVSGLVEGEEEILSEGTYKLYIFNNNIEQYRSFLPKFSQEITFDKKDYHFDVQVDIALTPGLYYYLIEEADTEEQFFVGKFRVEK